MDKFNLGENLRNLRLLKGISQDAMAEHLGISQTKYSKMERNSIMPTQNQLSLIAEIFKMTLAELIRVLKDGVNLPSLQAAANESRSRLQVKDFLRTSIGKFVAFVIAYVVVNIVYVCTKGLCSVIGTSHSTMILVGLIAATITACGIIYWIRSIKKSS